MEESSFKNLSTSIKQVFESENAIKNIFDILDKESRLNFSLCCKKLYSYFQKRNKILKTEIKVPHTCYLKTIDISNLKNILIKYKNITVVDALYNDEIFKVLSKENLINLERLEISCIRGNIDIIKNMTSLKELYLEWNYQPDDVTNLSILSNFINLEKLSLRDGKITDIEFIKDLKKLKVLSLIKTSIRTKDTLDMDYDLKKYHLILEELLYITPISYCTNLTELKLLSLNIKYIEPIN